jgi:hypothetical protein
MTEEEHARAVADENRRLRRLRVLVDLTSSLLMQARLSRPEAETLVAMAREQALALFPDKQATYDLILAPRFARLMNEFAGPVNGSKVLPFRRH